MDEATALTIKLEVSDGIIAPSYSDKALKVLLSKKNGNFVIFQIDPIYIPDELEARDVYGITIKQKRNNVEITDDYVNHIVTKTNKLNKKIINDIKLGMITLKYTQSNSLCVVNDGQVIGIGSGQQSRILCSNLALTKANIWYQKLSLDYSFMSDHLLLKNTAKDQFIELEREKQFGREILLNKLTGR